MTILLDIFNLLFLGTVINAFYLPADFRDKRFYKELKPVSDQQAVEFLRKYGYFKPPPLCPTSHDRKKRHAGCSNDPTKNEETLEQAIKNYQTFNGLPETGTLNKDMKKLMSRDRCGVEDFNDLRDPDFLPWEKEQITYAFLNFTNQLSPEDVKSAIRHAFDHWEKEIPRDFIEIDDPEKADIKIKFARMEHGDHDAFEGKGGTLAHATKKGLFHFDDDEIWKRYSDDDEIDPQTTDILWTAIHEVGHVLGLQHKNNPGSIMEGTYKPSKNPRGSYATPKLCDADIEDIQDIYGSRSTKSENHS